MNFLAKKLLSPHGRLSRGGFWLWGIVILGVLSFVPFLIDSYILHTVISDSFWPSMFELSVSNAYYWLTIWPMVVLGIKRFHDLEMTGYWTIALLPTYFLSAELFEFGHFIANAIGPWIYVGTIWLFAIFVLNVMQLFVRGKVGENRFGPDPLERS